MKIEDGIIAVISQALTELYAVSAGEMPEIKLEKTKPIFEGDYTFVVFPVVRSSKKSPEETANDIGNFVLQHSSQVSSFNVIKGFLNLVVKSSEWIQSTSQFDSFVGKNLNAKNQKVMVEYSSPNTNKPLHLGHIRNNLLGYSLSQLLSKAGYEVVMANLINDRGIHICKSMLAWQRFGNGETPESTGMKGDHLVGKYYVVFENKIREQTSPEIEKALLGQWSSSEPNIQKRYDEALTKLQAAKDDKQIAKLQDDIKELVRNQSELMLSCQAMLRDWEAGNQEVLSLWNTMNGWVYQGFESTYNRLGVKFDQYYYESNTYKLGKDIVQEGLQNGVFFQKEDGSVWIDLSSEGLDEKLVQRGDGTSVYITQDMGTADLKANQFGLNKSIYVVGNEQDYHFKVLFLIMQKLGRSYAPGMYHASYGMVDLPSGKMKSREGTVVDADDLLEEMYQTAKSKTEELGKTDGMEEAELNNLYHRLSLAALKFFILKVDPKKRMLFNPEESIDFQGDTGPFVMYTYTRIRSILRQAESWNRPAQTNPTDMALSSGEVQVIKLLNEYESTIENAAREYNPAAICQYVLDLAKAYNRLYNEVSILKEPNDSIKKFRLELAASTATCIKSTLSILGIEVVERM
jgi:arginyl-tRNA synthetase